jgi:hypothetical protein
MRKERMQTPFTMAIVVSFSQNLLSPFFSMYCFFWTKKGEDVVVCGVFIAASLAP